MDYKTLLENRRSIRDFTQQKVDLKVIKEILYDTCMAPSASNTRPWEFVVIQDQDLMKKISDESKRNLLNIIANDPNSSAKQYETYLRNPNNNVFYNAPCLIIIGGKNDHYHFYQNCSLAAAYLMFAATARNLGTCWIGLGEMIQSQELRQEIGLPDYFQIVAPLIIGYPKSMPHRKPAYEPKILGAY